MKPAILLLLAVSAIAQQPWERMQFGPFLQSSVTMPWSTDGEELDGITLKGTSVKLAHGASICFDSDLMRYSAGWSDGWLTLMGTPFDGTHRPPERSRPAVKGNVIFGASPLPGWSLDGTFHDPRIEPYGPLPAEIAKYGGLYVQGDRVTFAYTVANCPVLDSPHAEMHRDQLVLTRSLRIGASSQPLYLLVCEVRNDLGHNAAFNGRIPKEGVLRVGDLSLGVAGDGQWLVQLGKRVVLRIPPADSARLLKIAISRGSESAVSAALNIDDPAALTEPGPGRLQATVETQGIPGDDNATFALDTLTLPDDNPYNAWLKIGGFDFFADGTRAALCTWAGDVWIVSGIDAELKSLTWRRFASGLFQPLGLKIVREQIYVLGRDQITRLEDRNTDGQADFYANFNNDICATPNFHEFTYGLETDPEGNFYFSKGAPLLGTQYFDPISRHNGSLLRVSADGRTLTRFATGFRAPNGIGVGPNGEVTSGDNEGIWTPVCRLNWIREGGFYGCRGMSQINPPPATYDPPLCWLPFTVDNSTGGQVWVPEGAWGPLGGELLHLSYGKSRLFHVLKQEVKGIMQGGVVSFSVEFASGAMRGRFNPVDGQLYVCGLKGWQTSGARDGSFQRLRYTGKPLRRVIGLAFRPDGIELRFSTPLDRKIAEDLESYTLHQWNYRWTEQYGSDHYSVRSPQTKLASKGEMRGEPVGISKATLSADGMRVTLAAPLQTVMQIAIGFDLESADGQPIIQTIYGSINALDD
ncbi:MAG: hypothetical protein ACI8W8_002523 [Rhodothermales bacterium]|jgi:hypothetical protein